MTTRMKISRGALTLLAVVAVACESDIDEGSTSRAPQGDASMPDGGDGDSEPRYVASTRVWNDDGDATSYFYVLPSLDSDVELDPREALEVPGAAKLFAHDGAWFAIGQSEDPTITRYTLDEDGRLVQGDSMSLQPYGVASLWDTLYFVSPDKAYYPDRAGTQLIVWNPTTMETLSSIPLDDTVRDGYLANYGYTPVLHGDTLLFSVGWFDWEDSDSILPETGLVAIDTTRDRVIRVDIDDRCGGITQAVTTEGGDAYFASSALAAAVHRLGRLDTAPCALRIRAEEDRFDPDYYVDLADLNDGSLAGEPVPAGNSAMFLRVFDEALAAVEADDQSWELTGQSAWRWVRWNVQDDQIEEIDALDPSTADVIFFEVDGRVYGSETTPEYDETALIDLTAEGGPERGLMAPGFLHALARVN